MTDVLNEDGPRARADTDRRDSRSDAGRLSDVTLVIGIAGHDHNALAEVYRLHGGGVHAVARQICGPVLGDEVVQDTFLQLWRRPDRFDPGRGSLRMFLMIQAHSAAVDRVRSDTARTAREARYAARSPGSDVDAEVAALSRLAEAQMSLLCTLPARERDPIALAYYGGRTYRQVAELLDQPEGTIKSRIRTGLRRLREQLRNDPGEETTPA